MVAPKDADDADLTLLRAPTGGTQGHEDQAPKLLKQRFVLEEKLGAGGMGTVYKARDLRKVEARDRNPYLAVKVLNNDFRAHPDAFIALQREASKSQALAHPNIVSIYDFDKDGDIPFMTMELLEGQELADLLREYPNGLPENLAWPIIADICAGLRRAHEAGIAHADFKPGNVFVQRNGRAKILDFGIARAAQISQFSDDDTLFDPGRFAALTPAYASAQMLRGLQPEPLDDIYSLGVVIYLILAGQHPYLRVRADEAQAQGAKPKRLRQLGRRQWRTLESMLAFNREERPASMERVMAGLLPRRGLAPWMAGSLAAALVLAVGMIWLSISGRSQQAVMELEVRTGLQLQRIEELLATPVVTPAWEQQLVDEFTRLASLPGAQTELAQVRGQVLQRYAQQLDAAADLEDALAVLQSADRFAEDGRFQAGYASLLQRQQAVLLALLALPSVDNHWLTQVEAALTQQAELVADAPEAVQQRHQAELQALGVQAGERYLAAAISRMEAGELALAETLLHAARARLPASEILDDVNTQLTGRMQQRARLDARAQRNAEQAQLDQALAQFGQMSCQRMEAAAAQQEQQRLLARYPWASQPISAGLALALAGCVQQLAETDLDRAQSLQQAAIRVLGPVPTLTAIRFDPCAMRYLVGNGTQPGRSGFCTDKLPGNQVGPRLVVVPDGRGGRFAIGQHEISWRDLAPFCTATGQCNPGGDPGLPVTGIDLSLAQAFAHWLSAQSGFQYRLPQRWEWQLAAAAGAPDANRNCQVQVAGVARGAALQPAATGRSNDFGLINALGNAQEWVLDGELLKAAGGAYTDPLSRCEASYARDHSGRADPLTSFRLVREIP